MKKKDELRKLINTFNNSLENIRNIIKKLWKIWKNIIQLLII